MEGGAARYSRRDTFLEMRLHARGLPGSSDSTGDAILRCQGELASVPTQANTIVMLSCAWRSVTARGYVENNEQSIYGMYERP